MTAPGSLTTLAQVGTSAAAAVGVPGYRDVLGLGDLRQVVVCLIDGLGWQALREHAELAPRLSSLAGGSIAAAFPSTTPVGLASLGTGLLAGQHGLVGASFEYPETGDVLAPLQWGHHPTPIAVQPEPTVFEVASRAGVRVTSLSPAAYAGSGLTRAVLRGSEYVGVEDVSQRRARLAAILAEGTPSYSYVYWPELDRVGHEHGIDSAAWRAALQRVDRLAAGLCEALVPGSAIVFTSDHGMLDCPTEERIDLDSEPRLRRGVRRWAGEPRVRHVYTERSPDAAVLDSWREILGDAADVMTRDEVFDRGLLGPVDPALAERVGDIVAVARGHRMLSSSVDRIVSGLRGQHGGLTPQEMLVPALMLGA